MLDKNSIPLRASAVYILILVAALLFPFDFEYRTNIVKTGARWLSDDRGIELSSASVIRSPKPSERLFYALVGGNGITVEIWLSTENDRQTGPARIVSYSLDTANRNFTLAQDGKDLIFRLRTSKSDPNGLPELRVKDAFAARSKYHIVVSYDFSEATVYVNGKLLIRSNIFAGGMFSNWDPSHFLVLGNEATGDREWLGEIYRLAIYNRPLTQEEIIHNYENASYQKLQHENHGYEIVKSGLITNYIFNEGSGNVVFDRSELKPALNLNIMKEFNIIKRYKFYLKFPYQYGYVGFGDTLINILLFIPFGYLNYSIIKRRLQSALLSFVIILLFGMLFSLSIESLQYFMKSRHSSLTDVINNTLGVGIGIVIYKFCLHHSKTPAKMKIRMQ